MKYFFVKFQAPFPQKIINIHLYISYEAFICSVVWLWWLPNDIYFNNQSPHWKTILFVICWDHFMSWGWGFWLPVLSEGEGFCIQWLYWGEGLKLLPSSHVLGVCPRGDGFGWNWYLHKCETKQCYEVPCIFWFFTTS